MEGTLQDLTDAIAASPASPKLYGQRCTAYIRQCDYTSALEDSKTLIKLVPDAPVGYLKAGRCCRLLKKWKAAQRMLDMATERCADADQQTLKAIRTETRKLQEDGKELTIEPDCTIDRLPEELFVQVCSYLSHPQVIQATHVCKRWRRILLAHPRFWQELRLDLTAATRLDPQHLPLHLPIYLSRLQGTSLRTISLRLDESPTASSTKLAHRALQSVSGALTACNAIGRLETFEGYQIDRFQLSRFFCTPSSGSVKHCRIRCKVKTFDFYALMEYFPNLQSCQYVTGDGPPFIDWQPVTSIPNASVETANTTAAPASLRQLALFVSQQLLEDAQTTGDNPHNGFARNVQELELRGDLSDPPQAISHFSTSYPLSHLVRLVLDKVELNIPWDAASLPSLRELEIHRHCALPTKRAILRELHAPQLTAFSLYSTLNLAHPTLWLDFCRRHPLLERLHTHQVEIPLLGQSLRELPQLRHLQTSSTNLADTFLDDVAMCLPHLTSLDVSNSSNIKSGPLLRLVQARAGRLSELKIDGCRDLQKEAIVWLRDNVKLVKFSGWRDKNEPRKWGYR